MASVTCTAKFQLLLIAFCILIITLTTPLTQAIKARPYRLSYDVYIRNGISGKVPLVVHCKSKNDDLGIHSLNVGGIFHWHFKINLLRTTLFFCRMTWGQKSTRIDAFYANDEGIVCDLDGKCHWLVKEDGFYFSCDDATWKKKHDWSGK